MENEKPKEEVKEKPIQRIVLADVKEFRDSISIISELVTEADIKLTKEGIELMAMDSANVAMVIWKMSKEKCTEFEITEEQKIGIRLTDLKTILKRAGKDDIIKMEFGEKVKINMMGKQKKQFTLPILDRYDDGKEVKEPELKFEAKVTIPAKDFTEAIGDIDIIADTCSFVVKDKKFTIIGTGDSMNTSVAFGDIKIETEKNVMCKFAIEYLKKMIKGNKLGNTIVLNIGKDFPLKMEFLNITKGGEEENIENMGLKFILAPRISED